MNPKIINFYPQKDTGNFLGFCALQLMVSLNGQLIPIVVKGKVMRNSNNGHCFITLHQEAYKKPDGSTGYSNLIRIPEDKYNDFNKATAKAWDDYIMAKNAPHNAQVENQGSSQEAYYPHGMARNTQTSTFSTNQTQVLSQPRQYKDHEQEECPI